MEREFPQREPEEVGVTYLRSTTMFPEPVAADEVTVMDSVPCPDIIVQPPGTVHMYSVLSVKLVPRVTSVMVTGAGAPPGTVYV
jgi:hypothetical protein